MMDEDKRPTDPISLLTAPVEHPLRDMDYRKQLFTKVKYIHITDICLISFKAN
jgi:hypothetical protein